MLALTPVSAGPDGATSSAPSSHAAAKPGPFFPSPVKYDRFLESFTVAGKPEHVKEFSRLLGIASGGLLGVAGDRIGIDFGAVNKRWPARKKSLENLESSSGQDSVDLAGAHELLQELVRVWFGEKPELKGTEGTAHRPGLLKYLVTFDDRRLKAKNGYCPLVFNIVSQSSDAILGECISCHNYPNLGRACDQVEGQKIDVFDLAFVAEVLELQVISDFSRGHYSPDNKIHVALLTAVRDYVVSTTVAAILVHETEELNVSLRRPESELYPADRIYDYAHPVARRMATEITGLHLVQSVGDRALFPNTHWAGANLGGKASLGKWTPMRFAFGQGDSQWELNLVWSGTATRFMKGRSTVALDLRIYLRDYEKN